MAEEKKSTKEYDYDGIIISLENCILPSEKLDITPSMNDGLDRDIENDIRMYGCELIQVAGLLLKLPQVAMATGQVLLQRFYYSKSVVKHEIEICAMAAIFLAAKIEESPRRIRDVVNVYEHIKQRFRGKSHVPMDFLGNLYYNLKNAIIKSERRLLKDLGFCVHVKHPHKIIITYLQILEHQKNVALARKAWNYMNDSLRTDVFVRFAPEIVACACIFLAARVTKVNLPQRPPWWELFDASFDEIEDISLCILRLYSRPRRKITQLESIVSKLKKAIEEEKKAKDAAKESASKNTPNASHGSFTPSYTPATNATTSTTINNNNNSSSSKPSSKTNSPVEKPQEKDKRTMVSAIVAPKRIDSGERDKDRRRARSDTDDTSDYSSESGDELPSRKYNQRKNDGSKKRRSPSSESDHDRRTIRSKIRRSVSPVVNRKTKSQRDTGREGYTKERNGQTKNHHSRDKKRRSRSPVKRRSRSNSPPVRKEKYSKEKSREKHRSSDKYDKHDRYSSKIRR